MELNKFGKPIHQFKKGDRVTFTKKALDTFNYAILNNIVTVIKVENRYENGSSDLVHVDGPLFNKEVDDGTTDESWLRLATSKMSKQEFMKQLREKPDVLILNDGWEYKCIDGRYESRTGVDDEWTRDNLKSLPEEIELQG